jgi:hypothetical protein
MNGLLCFKFPRPRRSCRALMWDSRCGGPRVTSVTKRVTSFAGYCSAATNDGRVKAKVLTGKA